MSSRQTVMIENFSQILDQDKAKEILRRSLERDKLSHAYLFRGPAGVGKKSTAHAFAAAINCHQLQNQDACGICPSCVKFRSGNHPDFMLIEPQGTAIKIQQVRELKKALAFPPYEAKYRVVLLADVHAMRREAANSLLKTLEEPPADTILILSADEANRILPTITSRCQVIPFFALTQEAVVSALVNKDNITPDEAATLAAIAEGSLGRARMLIKKDLLTMRQQIIEKVLALNPKRPEAITAVLALAESAADLKEDLHDLLDLLKAWLRDLLLYAKGISQGIINRDLAPTFAAAGRRWNNTQLFDRLRHINRAQAQLARNCNRTLVCEVLFFALL